MSGRCSRVTLGYISGIRKLNSIEKFKPEDDMQYSKSELEEILEKHKKWLNGEAGGEKADLSGSDLSGSDLSRIDLRGSDLSECNLSGSNLDFSILNFSCKSLKAKFANKHIVQILYHAAMPTQHNVLDIDDDVRELFNCDLFKRVVNKFHHIKECGEFTGLRLKQ